MIQLEGRLDGIVRSESDEARGRRIEPGPSIFECDRAKDQVAIDLDRTSAVSLAGSIRSFAVEREVDGGMISVGGQERGGSIEK